LAVESTGTGIFAYALVAGKPVWDARPCAPIGPPPDAPVDDGTFLAAKSNAAKDGAPSNEAGATDLRWDVMDGNGPLWFALARAEQGGPPIPARPTRHGLGSRFIERSFEGKDDPAGRVRTLVGKPYGMTWHGSPRTAMRDDCPQRRLEPPQVAVIGPLFGQHPP